MRRTTIAVAALAIATPIATAAAVRWIERDAAAPLADAVPLPARDLDDATIVAIFDAANTADIETGRLAVERGHSKEVRDFGAMLVRDHEAVRQMGRDLAARLGVTPTPPADGSGAAAHAAAIASLRTKSGAEFDHAFLRHEVEFHRGVIDAVETTLLPAIRNAELKALVEKVAPAFRAHMLAADHLDRQLAGASGK
ncbi:MAG TPA: DUF4142 domain-containing protein [Gemmatimonadaceae bacterium]